jgi:spindle assembly abnormal protein 6
VLDLSEGDFLTLKNEQSLHVDFASFPHKLADLLQLCINSHKDERVSFYINVEIRANGECVFSVVENNEFKRLTHLALRFRSATDEILKNYLS